MEKGEGMGKREREREGVCISRWDGSGCVEWFCFTRACVVTIRWLSRCESHHLHNMTAPLIISRSQHPARRPAAQRESGREVEVEADSERWRERGRGREREGGGRVRLMPKQTQKNGM